MPTHLVTGGSGYVGEAIINNLHKLGQKVISLDVIENKNKLKNVEYIKGSILDLSLLEIVMRNVDFVHHNAALVPLTKSGDLYREVNVLGTKNLLKLAIKNEVKHFCHMSSSAVFGVPIELPLNNLSDRVPVEIYGKSKKDAEDLVISAMANDASFSASIIRPRTILGIDRLGIFQLLFKWISKGIDVFLIGKGNEPFQFAHINDIVNASTKSCFLQKRGLYNVGTLNFESLSSDLSALVNFAATGSRIRNLPENFSINSLKILDFLNLSPFAPWHYLTYHKPFYFESNYVYKELDFKPFGSNIDCLIDSYKSFINSKDNFKNNLVNSSPHKSNLKADFIDLAARTLSMLP